MRSQKRSIRNYSNPHQDKETQHRHHPPFRIVFWILHSIFKEGDVHEDDNQEKKGRKGVSSPGQSKD